MTSFEEDLDRALIDAGAPHQGQAGDAKGAVARIGQLGGKLRYYEDMIRSIRASLDAAESPGRVASPAPHENGGSAFVPAPKIMIDGVEVARVDKNRALARGIAEGIITKDEDFVDLTKKAPAGWFKKQDMPENIGALVDNLRTRGFDVNIPLVAGWTPMQRTVAQLFVEQGDKPPDWIAELPKKRGRKLKKEESAPIADEIVL
jgi:hypothetical protein